MATLSSVSRELEPVNLKAPFRQLSGSRVGTDLIVGLLLILWTMVLYQPILHNGFVNFDDPYYITENTNVRQGFSWNNLRWAFTTMYNSNWHPLTWLVHIANFDIFGMNPMGHHLASMLWHSLNVLLLFILLRRMTGQMARSAIAAAMFAVCPLNVEAVAWVAELKTLVSTTFLLLALLAYKWYVERRTAGSYLTTLALFTVGLLAKAIIMTLPFLMLLADYWPLKRMRTGSEDANARGFSELVKEKIPFFLISAASAGVTLHAATNGGTLASVRLRPIGLRIENAIWSYCEYLFKLVWPARLAVLYPFPQRHLPLWQVGVAAAVLLAVSLGVWHYRQTKRYLLVGWCWFLGSLVPVSGLTQAGPQAMADRYAYISFVGLFLMVVWFASEWTKDNRARQAFAVAAAVVGLVGYSFVSRIQMGYWRDSYTLFSHTLRVTKENPVAENDLGAALSKMGRDDEAMVHFENATRLLPTYSTAHYNAGSLLQKQNRLDEALKEYDLALSGAPLPEEAAEIYNNRAVAMLQLGRPDDALANYNAALKSFPLQVESLVGRASIEYQRGQLAAADHDLTKAFLLTRSPRICFVLGRVLEDEGDLKQAEKAFELTLQLSPGAVEAKTHLDAVRSKLHP
jgi:protein O-mannosyl-transferase